MKPAVVPCLRRRLDTTLRSMFQTSLKSTLAEAEETICATCDLAIKPCVATLQPYCSTMLLQNTQLQLLEQKEREVENQASARCVYCGVSMPQQTLSDHPLRELCEGCEEHVLRI
jgi:hypothetical protein